MSSARTLADLLDSGGDVQLENLDNTPDYTKPSSEPITYISGLQTALDAKIDDAQVLTNVPAGALFTDTTYSIGDSGLTTKDFTTALKIKLDGVATSANNYSKPSSEPISYITGLTTAIDSKVDDSQVLTDVPLNAVFTDTIGSNNFLIDVDGDNLSRGQLLEEISADDGQNRFVVDNIVTSNTAAVVTNGTEGMPGVADYATGVSPVATGTQYFFSFPTAQYNEGNHESPQPHAFPAYFTSTNGRTTYQAFDTNGKKWGKQEMGTGCKITWSVIPSGIEVGEWEYGEDSPYSLTSSDWTADIGFDPAADIRWCLQEWGNISGLSFYEVPWTDARRTGTNDLDFAHINFFCTNLGSSVLGHVTDFPGSVTDTNLAVSMHKRMIDSGDIAIGTAFNWYSNSHDNSYSGTVYNFRSVVLHELGHSFGMAHTNDTGTSMYPFAQSGETINGLADGDVKGIQTIYGLPLTGTQSTVFRTTKDNVAKDTMIVEHDFVSIGTTYDDTQLLVKGKMGVNTIFPQHEVDIVGTVRATSFDGDGSALAGVVVDADIGATVQAYDADLTTLATNGIGTSANQLVQLDGTAKLPAVDGSALTNLPAGGFTLGTATAGSYISSVNYTGIPSGTTAIRVSFSDVKTSTSADIMVVIGDAGGIETSGYKGSGTQIISYQVQSDKMQDGFAFKNTASGSRMNGSITLTLIKASTFLWAASGVGSSDASGHSATTFMTAGSKALSQELDRVTIKMRSGSFESGMINIAYL